MKINKIKVISYCGMISLLASLIVGLFGFSISTRNMRNIKDQLLKKQIETNINLTMKYINSSYGTLSPGDGTLLDSDGNSIEGDGVVESVLEDLGYDSTIFVRVNGDFKRISPSILFEENEKAMGTFLGVDNPACEALIKGELYIGETDIQGENYYIGYQPIKDKDEKVIGALFLGLPTKPLDDIIGSHNATMNKINILIIGLRAISLSSLVALVSLSVVNKKNNSR